MPSQLTVGESVLGKVFADWQALQRRLRSLPLDVRGEMVRVLTRDVADLRDDLDELQPRRNGMRR